MTQIIVNNTDLLTFESFFVSAELTRTTVINITRK